VGCAVIRTLPALSRAMLGQYAIKVPRRVELTDIRSSNGAIRINELRGCQSPHQQRIGARFENTRQAGDRYVERAVQVQSIEGETSIQTSNGADSRGSADSHSGAVRLTTSNGGCGAEARISDFQRSDGRHQQWFDYGAHSRFGRGPLKAETSRNSRVASEFEVRMEGENTPSRLEGVVGSGGPQLHLTTSQGSIRLLKL